MAEIPTLLIMQMYLLYSLEKRTRTTPFVFTVALFLTRWSRLTVVRVVIEKRAKTLRCPRESCKLAARSLTGQRAKSRPKNRQDKVVLLADNAIFAADGLALIFPQETEQKPIPAM